LEQQGSNEVHGVPSRSQQNLPATPLATVWSHLSLRQHCLLLRQALSSVLQRALAACGVAAMTSEARLVAAVRPNRRRVQASKRGASMIASTARVERRVGDQFTPSASPASLILARSTRYLGL
jgi:hypothetical protein